MPNFTSDLYHLQNLYHQLECELETQFQRLQSNLLDHPLLKTPAFDAVVEMDSRLNQLSAEWKEHESNLPEATRKEIKALLAQLRDGAASLLECTGRNEILLRQSQKVRQESIAVVRLGAQYLQSVRGHHENRPKFLDLEH